MPVVAGHYSGCAAKLRPRFSRRLPASARSPGGERRQACFLRSSGLRLVHQGFRYRRSAERQGDCSMSWRKGARSTNCSAVKLVERQCLFVSSLYLGQPRGIAKLGVCQRSAKLLNHLPKARLPNGPVNGRRDRQRWQQRRPPRWAGTGRAKAWPVFHPHLNRDAAEEFQICRADDGVGDAGGLDQFLLGDLGAEIAIVGRPVGSDDG